MTDQLVLMDGVTLRTLNPRNIALKNDYLESLLVLAFTVFPHVAEIIGGKTVTVIRGFLSRSYILDEVDPTGDEWLMKHSRGEAVEFTWEGWSPDEASAVALNLFEKVGDTKVHIMYDTDNESLYVTTACKKKKIVEKTRNQIRTIRE